MKIISIPEQTHRLESYSESIKGYYFSDEALRILNAKVIEFSELISGKTKMLHQNVDVVTWLANDPANPKYAVCITSGGRLAYLKYANLTPQTTEIADELLDAAARLTPERAREIKDYHEGSGEPDLLDRHDDSHHDRSEVSEDEDEDPDYGPTSNA